MEDATLNLESVGGGHQGNCPNLNFECDCRGEESAAKPGSRFETHYAFGVNCVPLQFSQNFFVRDQPVPSLNRGLNQNFD